MRLWWTPGMWFIYTEIVKWKKKKKSMISSKECPRLWNVGLFFCLGCLLVLNGFIGIYKNKFLWSLLLDYCFLKNIGFSTIWKNIYGTTMNSIVFMLIQDSSA